MSRSNEGKSSMQAELTLSPKDLQTHSWSQDGLHFGHPLSPLFASYMVPAMTEGTRLAMGALKAPLRQFIGKIHDGYYYQAVVPAEGDPQAIMKAHERVLEPLMGRQHAVFQTIVEEELWPLHHEIDQLSDGIQTFSDAIGALTRLQAIYFKFWDLHFRVVLGRATAGLGFEQVYHAAFPDRNPAEAYDLLLGTMNKSLEQDRALWQLATVSKANAHVLLAFSADKVYPALLKDPLTLEFRQALRQYLDIYGWRTHYVHEFLHETWRENPEYCLTVLKGYLYQEFDFDAHWQSVVATRERKVDEALAQIADPTMKATFRLAHQNALEAWSIDEDHHFYIDAMLPARSRTLLLKIGDLLVHGGVIEVPQDIFFFYLDELLETLDGEKLSNPRDLIATRRRELAAQFDRTPPPQLGLAHSPEPNLIGTRVFGEGSPGLQGATREVRGFSASPGRHVGPARIIRGPEEFFKIKPGDVLVCRNTAPAWTGLFATVGAVITETGGILSHAATVAREYHLPCIVGTREATRVFHDGDRVVVDGTKGIAVVDDG